MILKAARELQMNVVPEGGSLLYHDLTMITDGHTTIEHSLPVANIYRTSSSCGRRPRSRYTPTLIVGFGGLSGEYYWYERDNVWEHERLLTFTPRDIVDARSRRRIKAAGDDDFNHVEHRQAREAARGRRRDDQHGRARPAAGTWRALGDLDAGAGRHEPARSARGRHDQRRADRSASTASSVRSSPGKLADLVVLDRNPLENIRNTDSVSMVMVNGRLYDAATLNEIASGTRKRGPLYWER